MTIGSSILRRLHRDQRGTTLTEFVIILPVFIMVFAGILQLRKVGNVAVDHQVRANEKLWVATFEAEDEPLRMTPRGQFAQAFSGTEQNIMQRLDAGANALGGHWTEHYTRTRVVMPLVSGVQVEQPWRRRLTMEPENIIGDATVAAALVDDALTLSDVRPSNSGIMGTIINGAMQLIGGNAGYAANIRYGNVFSEPQVDEIEVAGISHTFETSYESRVSPAQGPPFWDPFSTAEDRGYLVSRLSAETENNYAELMDFIDQDLDRNQRYRRVPRWR
jgi:hypothetical protein